MKRKPETLQRLHRLITPLLLLWSGVLLFWRNGAIALWDQDEAAYAGFALRMVRTGDWLLPNFTWSAVHQKPPLHFWAIATAYQALGISEFTTRLPGSLAVLATGLSLILLGRGLWRLRVRAIAALLCWSSLLLPVLAKIALTDGLLVWLQTVAMLSWLQLLRQSPSQPGWHWQLLLWSAVGLGLLTKGPPILALVMGSELMLLGFRLWPWIRHQTPVGAGLKPAPTPIFLMQTTLTRWRLAPLALLPIALWSWLTIQQDGGAYLRNFLDWYLFKRLAGETISGQTGPPGYYAVVLAIAFLPWLPWCMGAMARLWRERRDSPEIWAWLIAGWLGYELIPSKLPSYLLGAYPAIALVIAQQVQRPQNPKIWRWGVWSFGVLSVLVGIGLGGVAVWLRAIPLAVAAGMWLLGAIGLIAAFTLTPLPKGGRGDFTTTFYLATVQALLLLTLLWGWVVPSWQVQRTAPQRLAEAAIAALEPNETLILAGNFDLPSIPFYLAMQGQDYEAIEREPKDRCNAVQPHQVWIVRDEDRADDGATIPDATRATITGWFSTFGQSQTYRVVDAEAFCSHRPE